jgi:hypothetical protein
MGETQESPSPVDRASESKEPKLKWQDAVGLVGIFLAIGGMGDMPLILRVTCFAACVVCLPISFSGHKNWPKAIRWALSAAVVFLMTYMSWQAISKSSEHIPTAQDNAEATAKLLHDQPPKRAPRPPIVIKAPVIQTNNGPCGINNIGGTVSGNTCISVPPPGETNLDLECNLYGIPVHIPANEIAHIWLLNERRGTEGGFFEIANSGDGEEIWPDNDRIEIAHQHHTSFGYKCVASNEGTTKVFDVSIPFEVSYSNRSAIYSANIGILDAGKQFTFYVFNECPIIVSVVNLRQYSARTLGADTQKTFPLTVPRRNILGGIMQFVPMTINWTGDPCN